MLRIGTLDGSHVGTTRRPLQAQHSNDINMPQTILDEHPLLQLTIPLNPFKLHISFPAASGSSWTSTNRTNNELLSANLVIGKTDRRIVLLIAASFSRASTIVESYKIVSHLSFTN